MFDWAIQLHSCMYASLVRQIPQLEQRPKILISDFATYAGFDAADALTIPYVINNPDLLNMLSPDDVAPYDFVPGTMTASSIKTVSGPDTAYGLIQRAIYPPLRVLIRQLGESASGQLLRDQQSAVGLTPTQLFTRLSGKVILVNNVFGLEYPRATPPNVILVGPMLERGFKSNAHIANEEYRTSLSPSDEAWLSWKTPAGVTLPVIWVSMGTIAPLNDRQVGEMLAAFTSGVATGRFRVLWKLDAADQKLLPSDMPDTNLLRVTTWVSSQLGTLAHPATRVFISHCGINSVHESVYLGTTLLCIPILADQADMAARVHDAGVGTFLSKSTFTAGSLTDSLAELLDDAKQANFTQSITTVRAAMKLAGGVERAADYIEFVAQYGSSALMPIDVSHPWYVRGGWDVFAIHVCLVWLLYRLARCCCCTHRPGKKCSDDRRMIRERGAAAAVYAAEDESINTSLRRKKD